MTLSSAPGGSRTTILFFPTAASTAARYVRTYPIHSLMFENDVIVAAPKLNEADLFTLDIAEGCVMNKLVQPQNLSYDKDGNPLYQVACCLLKEEHSWRIAFSKSFVGAAFNRDRTFAENMIVMVFHRGPYLRKSPSKFFGSLFDILFTVYAPVSHKTP